MSDRPQGSVRTEARTGDSPEPAAQPAGGPADGAPSAGGAPAGPPTGQNRPASQTQSIPTGGVRAQTPPTSPGGGAGAGAPVNVARPGARPPRKPGKAGRGPRRARLQLRHIDTWSAFKISLVLSIALFFIWMVAIGILYAVLSALGVFNTLNDLFGQLGTSASGKSGSAVITPGIVLGGAAVIGAINIILMTALCTVATFIYNMCADLVGGLEVTLSERD